MLSVVRGGWLVGIGFGIVLLVDLFFFFFFSSRRRHTRSERVTGVQTVLSDLDNFFARGLTSFV